MNKNLTVVGVILMVIGGFGAFFLNSMINPSGVAIVAARQNIEPGTLLYQIPETSIIFTTVRGDAPLLASMITQEEYVTMQNAGAVLIVGVNRFEPILKSAVVSSENPASLRLASLALSDPNLMIVQISGSSAPDGIRAGDLVDLAVSVTDLNTSRAVTFSSAPQPAISVGAIELPVLGPTPTPEATMTPTSTATPVLQPPISKTIVHAAKVVQVVREAGSTSSGVSGASVEIQTIKYVNVVIPREAFEFVMMANAAGKLDIGLLSPLVDKTQGPTIGASLDDLLTLFNVDRGMVADLAKTPSPTATPKPTDAPAQ